MFRCILVPLEGTRFGERALPVATTLARSAGAGVCLVTASAEAPGSRTGLAEGYLSNLADWLGTRGLGPIEWRVEVGEPAQALVECVARQSPDLIVMATHGCGTGKPGPASVAQELAAKVSVPLLLLPPDRGPPTEISFRRALVPIHLEADAAAPLGALLDFAAVTQAHLTLLHVVAPGAPAAAGAQQELDRLAPPLRERGASVATRVVTADDTAGAILAQWDAGRYDVAVLTVGEHGTAAGTVVDRVIRGARRPILLLHPVPASGRRGVP